MGIISKETRFLHHHFLSGQLLPLGSLCRKAQSQEVTLVEKDSKKRPSVSFLEHKSEFRVPGSLFFRENVRTHTGVLGIAQHCTCVQVQAVVPSPVPPIERSLNAVGLVNINLMPDTCRVYSGHYKRQWKTNFKDEYKYMHKTIIKVRVVNNNNV